MGRLIALFAFVIFAGFLVILGVEVPSPDLLVIIAFTLALVAYDMWSSSKNGGG